MSRTIRHSNRTTDVQPIEPLNEASPTPVTEHQEIPPGLPDWRDEYGFTPMENGENEWRLSVGKPPLRPSNPRSVDPDPTPQARPAAPEPVEVRKPVALVPAPSKRAAIVFTDTLLKPPTHKARRKRADRLGFFFTQKDRYLVEEIIAHGYLTNIQAARIFNVTPSGIAKRASRLIAAGLLENSRRAVTGACCLIATTAGAKHVGMNFGFPKTTPSMQRWDHHDAVVTLYPHLRQTEPEAGVWITEREIRACITREAQNIAATKRGEDAPWTEAELMSPRVRRLAPWTAVPPKGGYAKWHAPIYSNAGTIQSRKQPDGMLLRPDALAVVVECELSLKDVKGSGGYSEMAEAYLRSALDGVIQPRIRYFTAEAKGNSKTIKGASPRRS